MNGDDSHHDDPQDSQDTPKDTPKDRYVNLRGLASPFGVSSHVVGGMLKMLG